MADGGSAGPVRILFVDDSATDRTRGVGLLNRQRADWDVVPVNSAVAGLAELRQRRIDVVVTDLVMPEMDGKQFLQAVNERYPAVPVVLITSQGNDQIAAQSMELGAVNYVPKRRLADDLVPALEEILKAQSESRTARDVMRHVVRNRSQFSIDNDLEQVRALVHLVRDRLHSLHRFSAETVVNLTAAVREALLNAYFHGNLELESANAERTEQDVVELAEQRRRDPQFAARQIELEMLVEPDQLLFRVADDGHGFNASEVVARSQQPTDAEAGLSAGADNGFRFICRQVDSVSFNDLGNQITLTKSLRPIARV